MKDATPTEIALKALRGALDATNGFYSAGVEAARCEAAEILADSSLATVDDKNLAIETLMAIAAGEHTSAGIVNRVRAAKALLKHIEDPSALIKSAKPKKGST